MPKESALSPADDLRIHLLGGFRVFVGPSLVDDAEWRLRKPKNLVKLLALAPDHRVTASS